jgi:hypothetical protein
MGQFMLANVRFRAPLDDLSLLLDLVGFMAGLTLFVLVELVDELLELLELRFELLFMLWTMLSTTLLLGTVVDSFYNKNRFF